MLTNEMPAGTSIWFLDSSEHFVFSNVHPLLFQFFCKWFIFGLCRVAPTEWRVLEVSLHSTLGGCLFHVCTPLNWAAFNSLLLFSASCWEGYSSHTVLRRPFTERQALVDSTMGGWPLGGACPGWAGCTDLSLY
jgi:hypothetical protein